MKNKSTPIRQAVQIAKFLTGVTSAGSPFRKAASIAQRDRKRTTKISPKKKSTITITQTPGGSMAKKIRNGAVSSKSMGKLKTSKYRITKRQRNAMKGVEHTVEHYKELTTLSQTAWTGHFVTSPLEVRYHFFKLIVKQLFAKAGNPIRNFDDGVAASLLSVGDIIRIRYQSADNVAATVEYSIVAGSKFIDIVYYFYDNVALRSPFVFLKHILILPTTNAVGVVADCPVTRLDLENSYVRGFFKSSMKIQNRTVNGVDTQTDEVDNVPLYGRSYAGSGNGAQWQGQTGDPDFRQFIANYVHGYIEGAGVQDDIQEPLHQMYFKYVTQKGKVHLDPGYIKTSVLYHKQNMCVNVLLKKLNEMLANNKVRDSFGKFRFFGIERMIDTSEGGTITLGVEINHYLNLSLYTRFPNKTIPSFARSALPS